MWELFESRKWDEAVSEFADDLVVYWPHTGESFRGGQNFVEMNRAYPDWDHIAIDRIVAKRNLVVSQITVTAGPRVFRASSFFEMRSGKIARLTEYWVEEGLEKPPAWRAPFAGRTSRS